MLHQQDADQYLSAVWEECLPQLQTKRRLVQGDVLRVHGLHLKDLARKEQGSLGSVAQRPLDEAHRSMELQR